MNLPIKVKYAIQALIEIAHADNRARCEDISKKRKIPVKYLEMILCELRKHDWIFSKRGPHGGHKLAVPLDNIRLGTLIKSLSGPIDFGSDYEILEKLTHEANWMFNEISVRDFWVEETA